MKSEHDRLILNERVSDGTRAPSSGETIRRCRSLNELPGHHRVTVLRRGDTERTKARLEAVAAGMVELKHLREKQQQLMEQALCETARKQSGQRSEVGERPRRRHQHSAKSYDAAPSKLGEYPPHGVDGKKSRLHVKHPDDAQRSEEIRPQPIANQQNLTQHSSRHRDDLSRQNKNLQEVHDARAQEDRRRRHQRSQDYSEDPRTKLHENPNQSPRQERAYGQLDTCVPNEPRQQSRNLQGGNRNHDPKFRGEQQRMKRQETSRQQNVVKREDLKPSVSRQEMYSTDQVMQNQVHCCWNVLQSGEVRYQAYHGLPSPRTTPHNRNVRLAAAPKSDNQITYDSSNTSSHGAATGEGNGRASCSDNSNVTSWSGLPVRSINQNCHTFENRSVNFAKPEACGEGIVMPSPTYEDNQLRHSLVLTQSDQRFSRGRTQSVHENFYYFPTHRDSGNQNNSYSETAEKYRNNQRLQMNANNANSKPQTDYSNTNKNQPISSVHCSKMPSVPQSKSISWDELLVSVGLGKTIVNNDCDNKDNMQSYTNKSSDNQTIIADLGETKLSHTADQSLDELGEQKRNVSQKPYRSQSFSGIQPNVHYSNFAQNSDTNKRQKIDNSVPQNNAILNCISRHPSLSTISTKIFNPLHEVDIRSMNRPGPVHAVTLQYAGLTSRHMSLGSIPGVSGQAYSAPNGSSPTKQLASDSEFMQLGNASHPIFKQRNEFYSWVSQAQAGCDKDVRYDAIINEKSTTPLRARFTNESVTSSNVDNCEKEVRNANGHVISGSTPAALSRQQFTTSLHSPKYTPINTIAEDSEDMFEYPIEPSSSCTKPRSLSDTWDKSKRTSQDPVSSRGRSKTALTLTGEKSHESADALNAVESQGLILQKEGKVTLHKLEIESRPPLTRSPHPVAGLLTLKMSDVTVVVDEAYFTCDSARLKVHKVKTGTPSADNSSISSSSGNVSTSGDTSVCMHNNVQGFQRNKTTDTDNDWKNRDYKDAERIKRVGNNLSLENFDVNTDFAQTDSPSSGGTEESPTTSSQQNLIENAGGGLNTEVDKNKDSSDTTHINMSSLNGVILTSETSTIGQTLPDDQPTSSLKSRQPFKQTAL